MKNYRELKIAIDEELNKDTDKVTRDDVAHIGDHLAQYFYESEQTELETVKALHAVINYARNYINKYGTTAAKVVMNAIYGVSIDCRTLYDFGRRFMFGFETLHNPYTEMDIETARSRFITNLAFMTYYWDENGIKED